MISFSSSVISMNASANFNALLSRSCEMEGVEVHDVEGNKSTLLLVLVWREPVEGGLCVFPLLDSRFGGDHFVYAIKDLLAHFSNFRPRWG